MKNPMDTWSRVITHCNHVCTSFFARELTIMNQSTMNFVRLHFLCTANNNYGNKMGGGGIYKVPRWTLHVMNVRQIHNPHSVSTVRYIHHHCSCQ